MYKVMIVDDERALRSLLKKTVPWEELGLSFAGEAASGIEAINTIDEIQPDIAFVDIRMPFMDGIEFSKLAIKRYPNLKIIVLTAFDDFSYAKECIGIGISEYLLKPIVRADIQEALKKIISQLEKEGMYRKESGNSAKEFIKFNRIEEYVIKNYNNPELNLTMAATELGFNSSYFSRKFKEEIGKSFVDYLTAYRMEQACHLAEQGTLMYVTAQLVGIPDPNYFGKCFRKCKGISYTEYMKDAGSDSDYNGAGQP